MYLAVFLIEVILIFFYLTWEERDQYLNNSNESYSSYYSEDIIGNHVLKFSTNMKNEEKLTILKKSELINEIIEYIPNLKIMSEVFKNNIEDESDFKEKFLEYMECRHMEYIGVEITEKEFRAFIKNPRNLNACE
jgi:hypothetical protein